MSEEEKKALKRLETLRNAMKKGNYYYFPVFDETSYNFDFEFKASDGEKIDTILKLVEKQQKLINIFISNEAVKEGKDFNEIKNKYYECL